MKMGSVSDAFLIGLNMPAEYGSNMEELRKFLRSVFQKLT
jgi:hypothetical protein